MEPFSNYESNLTYEHEREKVAKITFSSCSIEGDGFDGASLRGRESQMGPSPSPEWKGSRPWKRC